MNETERKKILELQIKGFGYKKIAALLDLSVNTVKSYCRRHPVSNAEIGTLSICLNCRRRIEQVPHRKKKKFCSDKCRYAWWSKKAVGNKSDHICAACGKKFRSYKSKKRKYCSRKCYDRMRGVTDNG